MKKGRIITDPREIKTLLAQSRTIAVVGVSPKPDRDSHRVAAYLKNAGYRIIPVRPAQKEILGEPAVASLDDIREPVDIVDVFRRSELIPDHVPEALRLKPKMFWMQLGIVHAEAAAALTDAGIDVVMDRCIKVEHARFFPSKALL